MARFSSDRNHMEDDASIFHAEAHGKAFSSTRWNAIGTTQTSNSTNGTSSAHAERGWKLDREFSPFVQLSAGAPDVPLEKAVQLIKGGFSFRLKKEVGSSMEIWGTGYTEHRVKDAGHYQHHAAYIRENPVRARFADSVENYPYSSASKKWPTDPTPPWLKP